MKQIILFASVIFTSIVLAQSGHEGCSRLKGHNHQERSNILSLADIAKTEQYDIHHYFFDLNMDNTSTTIDGTVEIHAKSVAAITEFVFELHSNLTITNLTIDGIITPFTRNTSGVYVTTNMAPDSSFICSISYNGTAPDQASNPLGGGGLTNDSSPSWGNQVTWSLSEPFSAFEWFPCKQSLTDKIDSTRCHFTINTDLKAGSNGVLVGDVDLANGKHRMEWVSHYPIDYYLISVSVARYVDYSFQVTPTGATDPILIQNYIYDNPATLTNFQDDIDETGEFLELFSEKFGLYPFHEEKYGHCMAPLSGGMEHQTMTTQGYFTPGLTAHELAHQWFGDYVTAGSWSDLWLNEGFASYSEYIMYENLYPGQEVGEMFGVHSSVMSQPDGSVWIEDSLNSGRLFSGRLTYDKGSAIIHTLRYLINNDVVFYDILKTHLLNNSYSTASAQEFFDVAENLSGLNLDNFINEWYYGEGFPTYTGTWNQIGTEIYLNVQQTVSASTVTPLFTNEVDLKISRSGFADTTIRMGMTTLDENFMGTISGNVTSVSIDPDNWIINENGGMTHDASLVSLNELTPSTIDIFPNPTHGIIQVNGNEQLGEISIYSNTGTLVKLITPTTVNSELNLSSLEPGLYTIMILEKGNLLTKKITVL